MAKNEINTKSSPSSMVVDEMVTRDGGPKTAAGLQSAGADAVSSMQDSIDAVDKGEIICPEIDPDRYFFPCNREDALILLGSLCISEFFPSNAVKLAVQPEGVAVVVLGLRKSESKLLQAGREERFSVLVEVRKEAANRSPRIIEYRDIVRLCFRTQSEADEFRYRPVDEFDTETFECQVDANLFGLEGAPRFTVRDSVDDLNRSAGHIADRISAGVHCLLELGHAKASCRDAISRFLDGAAGGELGSEEIDFAAAIGILAGIKSDTTPSAYQRAVVTAFASAGGGGSRLLVDEVVKNFSSLSANDEDAARKESKWAEVARDVIKSRIALNGDHLSDEKSVLLRGALLGVVVDSVDALSSFLDAEKPSGPRVTATAAFLVGLKQGVLSFSWKEKRKHARLLSSFIAVVASSIANRDPGAGRVVKVSRIDSESASTVRVLASDIALAEWSQKKEVKPDALSLEWLKDFEQLGYLVKGPGKTRYSWVVQFSPERLVEVTHCSAGDLKFPMLRYYFDDGQKIRKAKETAAVFGNGGMFWCLGSDDAGQPYLSCDLPSLPDARSRELLLVKLNEVLNLCIVPRKPSRKKKKPTP